jgi:hypothetical protein
MPQAYLERICLNRNSHSQPFANDPKLVNSITEWDGYTQFIIPLCGYRAANGTGYTNQPGAEQKESAGLGDIDDGKTRDMSVVMRQIGNETGLVAA